MTGDVPHEHGSYPRLDNSWDDSCQPACRQHPKESTSLMPRPSLFVCKCLSQPEGNSNLQNKFTCKGST